GPEGDVVRPAALVVELHHVARLDGQLVRNVLVLAPLKNHVHIVGRTRRRGRRGRRTLLLGSRGRRLLTCLLLAAAAGSKDGGQRRHQGNHTHRRSASEYWNVFRLCEPFHKSPSILPIRLKGSVLSHRRARIRSPLP